MKFIDLSADAKENAVEKYRDTGIDFGFYAECVIEDAKEIAKILGIEIGQIYYSGFCSQGDGACFTGRWDYKNGSISKIKGYAPLDEELHRIAKELQKASGKQFYKVGCSITCRGHYYNEASMRCNVMHKECPYRDMSGIEDDITDALADFAAWIYNRLEKEWEYQNSEEAIVEAIICNEYEYNREGEMI